MPGTRADFTPRRFYPGQQGTPILLTNKTVLNAGVIGPLPELHYIGVLATGYNIVHVAAGRQDG